MSDFGMYAASAPYASNLSGKVVTVVDEATKQVYRFNAQDLKGVQNPVIQTLQYASSVTMDLNVAKWARITLDGNINAFSFSNLMAGDAGLIWIVMGGSGNHTINWGSAKLPETGADLAGTVGDLTVVGYAYDGIRLIISVDRYGPANSGSVQDTTPPYVQGAVVNVANELLITMSETSLVFPDGFTPTRGGDSWAISGVTSIGGGVYKFSMATAAQPGEEIRIGYNQSVPIQANKTRDIAGNLLGSFSNALVQNNLSSGGSPQLNQPTGNTATAASQTQINVSVNAVANATNYILEESTNGTSGFTQIYSGATPSYNRTGLTSAQTRYYRWKAQAAGYVDSPYSSVSNATTNGASQLGTPQNFTATAIDESQIDLSCNAVANATSYLFERSPNGTNGWITLIEQASPSYSNVGLDPATQYFYRVSAKAAGFTTSNYATANATTGSGNSFAPTNLSTGNGLSKSGTTYTGNTSGQPGAWEGNFGIGDLKIASGDDGIFCVQILANDSEPFIGLRDVNTPFNYKDSKLGILVLGTGLWWSENGSGVTQIAGVTVNTGDWIGISVEDAGTTIKAVTSPDKSTWTNRRTFGVSITGDKFVGATTKNETDKNKIYKPEVQGGTAV